MENTIVFETFQTVPVVSLSDMTPYMQLSGDSQLAFPIPGEEFNFMRLDLSRALIRHPAHTFFVQLTDDSLAEGGYCCGDIAIVDRQASPRNQDIVIAYLEGEFTLRRLRITEEMFVLESDEEVQEVEPDASFSIWGVVKDVIHV
ncbi:MAG: LexA family transcriptional regulator [Lewinellaceae bacterium]|nr:hypothetical protein [Phaeodactylibacter sp.]MCB9352007.1 LexA family transcriptional regulator [Lewinellaceae bacterium]